MEWDNFFSIYSLIYIPLILCSYISNLKAQKRVIFFGIIVLTLFRGLRWDLGTDWYWYEKSFNELDFSNFYKYITQDDGMVYKNLEAGWALLMVLCKKLFGTYTSFLLVSNFIILSIYYKISTFFSNNKPIVCFASIVTSANFFPVRQDLAVVIFFLGFCFLVIAERKKYIVLNIIAYFCHQSAIVLLPISLFLQKFFLKYKVVFILMIAAFIFGEYLIPVLMGFIVSHVGGSIGSVIAGYYYEYSHNNVLSDANYTNPILPFILNMGLYSLFYISFKNMTISHSYDMKQESIIRIFKLNINAFILYMLINTIFLRTIESLARLGSYLSISQYILISLIISWTKDKNKKNIYITILVCYLFYRYYKQLGFYPELMFPYHSIFD